MSAAILRLLTIASLVLMSIGMGAGAFAAPAPITGSRAECVDHPHRLAPADQMDHNSPLCSMACTAMPAVPGDSIAAPLLAKPALDIAATQGLDGVILEIATPPPRQG
jgi:hypothetical protein